jgi:hypothetical protein
MSRPDSSDALDGIEETLAILSDPLAMEQIRESERAIAAGELGTSLADVQAQLERRILGGRDSNPDSRLQRPESCH